MHRTRGLISYQDVPKTSVPVNDHYQGQNQNRELQPKFQILHEVQECYDSTQPQQSDELQDADDTK